MNHVMGLIFRRKRGASRTLPAAFANAAVPSRKGVFRRLTLKARILVGVPLFAAVTTAAVFASLLVYYTVAFPDPLSLRHKERAPTIRILARDDTVLAQRGGSHDYIPLDLLPPMVIDAVVATEDRRFNDHWGLDPIGLVRAAFANLRAGRFAQGGSTLTQQLAKNLFLSSDRTMGRKLEELVLALWLELRLGKKEILELYLNRVYFGGGAYGIEAASQRYFDKSARELSIAEAAILAGLLKAPSKYSPATSPDAARARGRVVLTKMREFNVITEAQEARARAQTVQFVGRRPGEVATGADYAVDYVLERLPAIIDPGYGEVIVETTIEPRLQQRASETLQRALVLQGSLLAATQGAVTLLDNEGRILALVGGRSYADSQFNRAIKAKRQPGSAFKPFVYLAAIEAGQTPDTVTYDLPLSLKGWAPKNDNGRYSGAVTLRQALSHSINTVAVRLLLDIGAHRVASAAHRLGIESELREDASLALGTSEVSLLELTGAYTAFANGGHTIEPHIIRRVRLNSGRVLYAHRPPAAEQAIALRHVGAMTEMLNEVITSGTGRRARIAGHPAAGKTGTSQEFRDAWFVGYTAYMTAGVWIGNDNGQPMNKVRGGQLPAEIWHDLMQVAHAGKTPLPLAGLENGPFPDDAREAEPVVASGAQAVDPGVQPWLAEKPETLPAAPAASASAAAAAPRPNHPNERIDEDFIARALGDDGASTVAATAAPATPVMSAFGETEERNGRFIVRPPSGLMSLGAGDGEAPDEADDDAGSTCLFFGYFC